MKLDLDGAEKTDTQYAPKLRSSVGRAHTLKEVEVDVFGNSTSTISQGCIEGCSTPDETILSVTEAGRPQGDPTGWLWRTTASYIPVGVEKRHHTSTTFDDKGRSVSTKLYISGMLALDRFREAGPGGSTDVAPPPADSSEESGENGVIVSRVQYDAFGHTTLGWGTGNRCRKVTYDPVFAQLPQSETVFAGLATQSVDGEWSKKW